MEFPKSFFEDEVRDGFYVPSMMKRAWAAQLEVLEDIEKVCRKHNIHYQADYGTLIGAIRHGGFIPWDDDMDISMLRKDYDIFNQVALDELPEGYGVLNFDNSLDGSHDDYLTRLYNTRRIRIDRTFLNKFHGFPFVAGMDIFPLDYIPPTEEEDEMLTKQVGALSKVADMFGGEENQEEVEEYLKQIEDIYDIKLDKNQPIKRQLFQMVENLLREYTGEGSEYLTNAASRTKWDYKEPVKYYEKTISLPFEVGHIDVPIAYDGATLHKAVQYMQPIREQGGHGYPFYKKMEKELDSKLTLFKKYAFSEEDLNRGECGEESVGIKSYAREMLRLFGMVRESVVQAVGQGNTELALELLEDCQEGAITLGGRIEEVKGEGYTTVSILEQFCEMLYNVHEMIAEGGNIDTDALDKQFEEILFRISDSVQKDIIERKVIVFMPYKASLWDSLESIWKAAVADPSCDVYVVPLPYCEREFDGALGEVCYEGEQFPEEVQAINFEIFNFTLQHPDMIFIHNPYDEYSIVATIPPMYYAKELRKYTDQLVYVPWFVTDDFDESDTGSFTIMDYYCTMPGVVCADKVIVQSEKMRETYIKKLIEFAGDDTRSVWEEKILGLGSPKYDKDRERRNAVKLPEEWKKMFSKADGGRKKVILYNTVPEAILEHGSAMIDKIRNTLAVFEGQKEAIALVWCPNLSKSDYVKELEPRLWKKYQQLVKEYSGAGWGICCDLSKDEVREAVIKFGHGYYGDPDSIVRLCRQGGMAALIQNVKVLYDRQNNENVVLPEHSADDSSEPEIYQKLEQEVIRESTDSTLIQLEQFLMRGKKKVEEEKSSKTYGEVILEALK
ncbi:MAG: LicD family protein [Lachnospiraceae bacterium]|nr:LicD family protein [Lachnospiraceae bacterium]